MTAFFIVMSYCTNAQNGVKNSWEAVYWGKNQSTIRELNVVKKEIGELLNAKKDMIYIQDNQDNNVWGVLKEARVLDDRIELKVKRATISIPFETLLGWYFKVDQQVSFLVPEGFFIKFPYSMSFPKKIEFQFHNTILSDVMKLADDLFAIQYTTNEKEYTRVLSVFKPLALSYHELKVKPPVSEEQRKYIVQANSFNQDKDYYKAIELYKKACEIDPVAYPAAYSNLGLLCAQVLKYHAAINYMKMYLMLVPEAEDARTVQDKIYEWEAKITQ